MIDGRRRFTLLYSPCSKQSPVQEGAVSEKSGDNQAKTNEKDGDCVEDNIGRRGIKQEELRARL